VERRFRLTQTTDFMRVRRCGKSYAHPLVVLIVQAAGESTGSEIAAGQAQPGQRSTRVGISASRSVGNAVQRNRAKRRLRASIMTFMPQIRPGYNVVLLARKQIEQAGYAELCSVLRQLFQRAGLLEVTIDGK
jgi:ribonuclease P protein component